MFSVNLQSFHEERLSSCSCEDDLEEGSIETVVSSDEGDNLLQEESLNTETDMLERLCTVDQAHNIDLFQQLRAWQAEQREQLIREQQNQLLQLHAEQQAAESRVLVQRQNLWNFSKTTPSSPGVKSLPQKRSQPEKVQGGLPRAIASSTLALARLRLQESVMVNSDHAGHTPVKVKEHSLQTVPKILTPSHTEEIGVDFEKDVASEVGSCIPDSKSETDDLHAQLGPELGTVNEHKLTNDQPDNVPSDGDAMHRLESGMSVSEYDELPVGVAAARGKSFEELVLEQIEKEEHLSQFVPVPKRGKSFLKKGQGTARFRTQQRPFRTLVRGKDLPVHSLKQSASCENELQVIKPPRSTLAADSVVQPISRKSCLKKKAVQNMDSVAQVDIVSAETSCIKTPVTSTPDRKQLRSSADNVHVGPTVAEPSSRRDSTGDASYIACMQAQAKKEVAEIDSLQEFELLEHFVDDNASFTSNTSTISQIFARHDVRRPDKFCGVQQNGSGPVNCTLVNKEATVMGEEENEEAYSDENTMSSIDDSDDDGDGNATLVDDTDVVTAAPSIAVENTVQPTTLQTIYRKIASMNGRCLAAEAQSFGTVHQRMLLSNGSHHPDSHLQTCSVENVAQESAEYKQGLSQENDYIELDSIHAPVKQVRDSDVVEHAAAEVMFSDEMAWSDSVISSPVHADRLQRNSLSSNLGSTSSSEALLSVETGYHTAEAQIDSPPTSKLAQKLFPKLKPQKPKTSELKSSSQADVSNHVAEGTDVAATVTSPALREKLAQLEAEIHQFRSENAALTTLRKEREQLVDRLKKEMAEFERQKADELQRFEEFKAEEIKKLKKERKVFETYQKSARAGPDRQDREAMEMLKSQVNELREDTKRKEQKWMASNKRLRGRVEQLEQENAELRDEIRVLEQRRLQEWKPRKNDPVPAAQSEAKLVESAVAGHNAAVQTSQKQAEKSLKQNERQKRALDTEISKSAACFSSDSDTKPSSETKVNSDIVDESEELRNSVPKPLTVSPPAVSTNAGNNEVKSLSAVRKTAPKSVSLQSVDIGNRPYDQVQHPDGKVERVCPDGSREVLFTNGTRKQISSDGQTIIVSFFNGDIKQISPDGRVVYYYADAQTTHTTYSDGLQVFQFTNGQVEKHYIDGTKEIQFPDQTIKYLFSDGSAESVFLDGTVVHVESSGNKQITFPNGQKEIHTALFKKREYPDGTTKTVFTDGRQETRYSNGRVRVKDVSGVVVLDQLA